MCLVVENDLRPALNLTQLSFGVQRIEGVRSQYLVFHVLCAQLLDKYLSKLLITQPI